MLEVVILAPTLDVPETDNVDNDVTAPLNIALPTIDKADELPLIALAVTVEAVIVLAELSTKGPSKVTDAEPGAVKLPCKLILPVCEAPPKVMLVKLVPRSAISPLKISSTLEPASVEPPTLIT